MTPERRAVIRREAQTMLNSPGSSVWPARAIELLDEVDRLRALWAAVAKNSRDQGAEIKGRREHAAQLKAEVERLTAALTAVDQNAAEARAERDEAKAQVERLAAKWEQYHRDSDFEDRWDRGHAAAHSDLAAQLRAVLGGAPC